MKENMTGEKKEEGCFGLLGKTLEHSFSPQIHGLFASYQYRLFPMEEQALAPFLEEEMKKKGRLQGLNVTIPYKKKVMDFCERISPEAREIGCVNTLVRNRDGSLTGYNTDAYGLDYMARKAGIDFSGKGVLILGNGATSLTASYTAKKRGAAWVKRVSRTGPLNYFMLQKESRPVKGSPGYEARNAQIIINTTPCGMYPQKGGQLIDLEAFPLCQGVLDVIYHPLATPLLLQARRLGLPHANGLSMLVAQAKKSCEYFTGQALGDEKIHEVDKALLRELENIVLVGMPGCGKTTVGQQLALLTGRSLVDTDEMIIQKAGCSISRIFEKEGQESFRDRETQAAFEAGRQTGKIISTGGGIVLKQENIDYLRQNGRLVWLCRDLSLLPVKGNRPLSKDRKTLMEMYEKRKPLYEACADIQVINEAQPWETAREIVKKLEVTL